jgi:hypothetical protein
MRFIQLNNGYQAVVDDADFQWLSAWKWYVKPGKNGSFYAARKEYDKNDWHITHTINMHRIILNAPLGMQVDHKDGNGLNNQRNNLRLATPSQNGANSRRSKRNTSGYKGVIWNKRNKRWQVRIMVERRMVSVGYFIDIEDAAIAYANAASKYFGEFARVS